MYICSVEVSTLRDEVVAALIVGFPVFMDFFDRAG